MSALLLAEQEAEPESFVLVLLVSFPLGGARAVLVVMMAVTSLKKKKKRQTNVIMSEFRPPVFL